MKKLLLLAALSITLSSVAQTEINKKPCGTYNAMDLEFAKNPQSKINFDLAQQKLKNELLKSKSYNAKTAAFEYTVPVVFHVLHTGGTENVSDSYCINSLIQVNKDFARTGADANTVAAPFVASYINSDIKFMIATKDPNGNCTSGVVHYYDTRTDWNSTGTSYSGITWDPTKYLNIIVVKVIDNGQLGGYTWLPGTWPTGSLADAIVFDNAYLGGLSARILSHEIGHWLNLPHVFGNTNDPGLVCGDDGIADTPPTKGSFGCPSSLSGNVCNVLTGTDNVENFMNYSNCTKNFTTGQTNVMRATLAANVSGRDNLWSPANIIATGVNGTANCAPICDFVSTTDNYTVCSGTSLTMKDFSYNGIVSTYSWSGVNANIAFPTASLTSVLFPNPGTSIITLSVTNGQGSSTKTRTVTVINSAAGVPNNYGESFEAPGLPAGWIVTNPNPGSITWEQTSLGASMGNSSYYIEGAANIANQIDYLQMPTINILNNPNNVFNFKYAYARFSGTTNDVLKVQASTNCGGTWQDIVVLSAGTMASGSGGILATPYIPVASEWKLYDVTLHPNWFGLTASSSVMMRFAFIEDQGGVGFANRFYLDEINFGDPNGLNELSKSIALSISPNPSNGEVSVKFNLSDAANVKMIVTDVLGKTVLNVMDNKLQPGLQNISVNKSNTLSKGVYLVNLYLNDTKICKKLIIE